MKLAILLLLLAGTLPAQPDQTPKPQQGSSGNSTEKLLAFGAVSIKPASPNLPDGRIVVGMLPPTGGPGTGDPGRIRWQIVSLKLLVRTAYPTNLTDKITGPDWMDGVFFQVEATMPPDTTKDQLRVMLRNLLADRFKLKIHQESKESPTYSLVIAKGGPKMKESSAATGSTVSPSSLPATAGAGPQLTADGFPVHPNIPSTGTGMFSTLGVNGIRLTARQQTMQDLAHALAAFSSRPLTNDTGLTAEYDFILTFAKPGLPTSPDADDALPDIFTALEPQLGLKLESKRGSADVIVVDHIEKVPTQN
jgi:uncharacterized protein (TIGR03435 family)